VPKQSAKVEVNTFVKGFITEASPLNFPANATRDEENFVINPDGTRSRRLGIDAFGTQIFTGITEADVQNIPPHSFVWKNVAGDSNRNIVVIQGGYNLYFFDLLEGVDQPVYLGLIDITSLEGTYSPLARVSFTSVDGILIVAGGGESIGILEYLPDFIGPGLPITLEAQRIQVRDLWGIEET
jgi:hypothetical protein